MESPIAKIKIEDRFKSPIQEGVNSPNTYARSKTYEKLKDEIYNYTIRKTGGGSVLLSGHRGAGKTTLVQNVINDLMLLLSGRKDNCKPLMVPLHGPDLLDITRLVSVYKQPGPSANPVTDATPPPATAELSDENKKIKNVLENLTISLYRALADEFYDAFRQKINSTPDAAEFRELIGLFRLELDESPDVSTLREIWSKAGFLESGVLFPNRGVDQGIQEIVVLSSAAQAFRIVTGSISNSEESAKENESEKIYSSELKIISKDIINAVFGLLSGIAVGAGVYYSAGQHYLLSSLAGIVTAFLANFTFTLSSKTTTRRKKSKQYKFIRNTDISSLNRELPNLIRRIRDIGLAPIFVVDELDKVIEPPFKDFGDLISYLKKLVSDNSFFCFLTDRNYFDFISKMYGTNRYPKEYTYFTHRFYVNYTPNDLHVYLDELFELHTIADPVSKADAILMQYLLLNRANLHAIDLRREIIKKAEEGYLSTAGIKSKLGYRFPVMVQLAIESILEEDDLAERFEQDAYFSQLINDTLYYPLRVWLSGEKKLNTCKSAVVKYMLDRSEFEIDDNLNELIKQEKWVDLEKAIPISMTDIDLLIVKLNKLTELLLDYTALYSVLSKKEKQDRMITKYQNDGIWNMILDIIPGQPFDRSSGLALLKDTGDDSYEWRYDYFGRSLEKDLHHERKGIIQKAAALTDLNFFLVQCTLGEAGLKIFATNQIINSTPDWTDIEFSIGRLNGYSFSNLDYPDLESDLQNVEEYCRMIVKKGSILAKTFVLSVFIKSIATQATWTSCFSAIGYLLDLKLGENHGKINNILIHLNRNVNDFESFALDLAPARLEEWKFKFANLSRPALNYGKLMDQVQHDWLENWQNRLIEHFTAHKNEFEPDIDDLICGSSGYSFAWRAGNDINKINKSSWFSMLVDGMSNTELIRKENITGRETPAWMVVPALLKLGFSLDITTVFKVPDNRWKTITEKFGLSTIQDGDFLIIISEQNIITSLNDYLLNSIKKPLLPILYSNWLNSSDQIIIKNILLLLMSNRYKNPTLVADFASNAETDKTIREIGTALKIDPVNIYRMVPSFGSDFKSEFKVIRRLEELGSNII